SLDAIRSALPDFMHYLRGLPTLRALRPTERPARLVPRSRRPPKFRPIPAPAWSTEVDPPPVTAANSGASTSGIAAATKIMTMPIAASIQLPPSDDSTRPSLITTAAIGLTKTSPNITPDHREKIAMDPSNDTATTAAGM